MLSPWGADDHINMLVPIIDGTKGRQDRCSCRAGGQPPGLLPAPDGFSNSRPRKSDAYRGSPSSRSDDPWSVFVERQGAGGFHSHESCGPRGCCWASQEDCPTALHSGVRCGLCQRQRLWTRRRKISALFGVQLLGSSPIIFDGALWHAPAGLKSAGDSGKITAQ